MLWSLLHAYAIPIYEEDQITGALGTHTENRKENSIKLLWILPVFSCNRGGIYN